MNFVALIEPSPTLRFGLNRLLQKHGFRVQSFDAYLSFQLYLNINPAVQFDLIVLGWPGRSKQERETMTELLSGPSLKPIPALVFVRHMDEPGLDAIEHRSQTIVQLWKNYRNSLDVVHQLIKKKPHHLSQTLPQDPVSVLLVDDSKSARKIFGKVLKKLNYNITEAADAEQAWKIVQNTHVDLAVIDYFMPGENGAMLCQRLSESTKHQHIIKAVLTGTYKEEIIEESLNAGAKECMFKNESMNLFKARVRAMAQQVLMNRRHAKQKNHFESILSSVGDGIYGVDKSGKLIFINPAALKILHYQEPEHIVGQFAHHLFHHSDEYQRLIEDELNYIYQAYLLGDTLNDWETTFWTSERQPIPVECTIRPLHQDDQTQGSVVVFKNISERKLIEDELNWQLNHDHLTQLLNRTYFEQLLDQELYSLKQLNIISAIIFIDLDNFKLINDQAGHAAGDQLLITIGEKIRSRLRHRDFASRLSGDEFAVLLHDIQESSIEKLADNFKEVLENINFSVDKQSFPVSGSLGVCIIDGRNGDKKEALERADFACRQAKSAGKNQVHIFSNNDLQQSQLNFDSGWRRRIEQGLKNNDFKLLFQPVYRLQDIEIESFQAIAEEKRSFWLSQNIKPNQFEVFLRLEHDDGKLFKPGAFLSDAERFDLINQIDFWVIKTVFEQLKDLTDNTSVSINISASTLLDKQINDKLTKLFKSNPETCFRIQLEIKEHHLLHYREQLIPVLESYSEQHIRFQVDDFGRNFSLFSRIRELPISGIKIDGLFTQNIAWDPVDRKLMHSMAEVARASGISTTVKSIETLDALLNIEQGGINFVQGHLLALPVDSINSTSN